MANNFSQWLYHTGLSNTETNPAELLTATEVKKINYKYKAICTSYRCVGKTEVGHKPLDVPRHTVDCPTCGSVIFWERYV
jgi:hypothetical protein